MAVSLNCIDFDRRGGPCHEGIGYRGYNSGVRREKLMKRSSRPARTPSKLSDSVHKQLNMYALVAGASGVSLLALSQPAEGKIIYTPVHKVIAQNSYFGIDLNHDGIVDFTVSNSAWRWNNASINSVDVWPNPQESALVEGSTFFPFVFAADIKRGTGIPNQRFYSFGQLAAQCLHGTSISNPPCKGHASFTMGKWINVKSRYLGLTFKIHGSVHYGWARLNVEVSKKPFAVTATVTGFAYETIANKGIVAGQTSGTDVVGAAEPPVLGRLAQGSTGVRTWSRKEPTNDLH
jgi:hypothetical protein